MTSALPPPIWAILTDRATPALLPWMDVPQLGGYLPMDAPAGTKATVHWIGQDPDVPAPAFSAVIVGQGPVYWVPDAVALAPTLPAPPERWMARARAIGGEEAVSYIHDRAADWAEEHGLDGGDPRTVAFDAYAEGWLDGTETTLAAAGMSVRDMHHVDTVATRLAEQLTLAGYQPQAVRSITRHLHTALEKETTR